MESHYSSQKRTRDLIAFFVLAYAFSWLVGIPLALSNQGVIQPVLPEWAHYLFAFGPLLSAFFVTWLSEGRSGLRVLGSRIVMWKVRPIWWVVALSPLLIGLAVSLLLNAFTPEEITLATLGEVEFLPPLGIGALLLWILTFGVGEETGWRGYALPRLQYGRSAFPATIILWIFWALWHLPVFFYLYDPSIALGWFIGLFAGAVLFTWLFNSTAGSVLIGTVWHGCFNYITSPQAGAGMLATVVSTIVMIWAVVIVVVYKPTNLSHAEKVTK
ncbi:MAG: CPBP family intramembrane metalloprotease [Anaerolineales bacterium]|nr:CPBP family intramembrane metalloprotease [Anaerolineales bacterium]